MWKHLKTKVRWPQHTWTLLASPLPPSTTAWSCCCPPQTASFYFFANLSLSWGRQKNVLSEFSSAYFTTESLNFKPYFLFLMDTILPQTWQSNIFSNESGMLSCWFERGLSVLLTNQIAWSELLVVWLSNVTLRVCFQVIWAWQWCSQDRGARRQHYSNATNTNKNKMCNQNTSMLMDNLLSNFKIFCECVSRFHGNTWGLTINWNKISHIRRLICNGT